MKEHGSGCLPHYKWAITGLDLFLVNNEFFSLMLVANALNQLSYLAISCGGNAFYRCYLIDRKALA